MSPRVERHGEGSMYRVQPDVSLRGSMRLRLIRGHRSGLTSSGKSGRSIGSRGSSGGINARTENTTKPSSPQWERGNRITAANRD
ncbi:unnamed protein product [Arctogadus glacialis]